MHDNVALSAIVTSQFSIKDPLSKSSEEVHIWDVFQCDGLLVCATRDGRLVVWNPCLGETKWIQSRRSYKGFGYYALGKSSCNKYKILAMHRSMTLYEVYDFASNSWRSVGNPRERRYITLSQRCGVSLTGSNYWLAYGCNYHTHRQYGYYLLNFDFSTETFQRESIPHTNLRVHDASLSVVREEKLCLLMTHPDINTLDVWTATKSVSTGIMSWSKFLTAKPNYKFSRWMSFLADEQNKVVVCCCNYAEQNKNLHIVGEDRHIQVNHHGAEYDYPCLLSYVPTLVHIPQVI